MHFTATDFIVSLMITAIIYYLPVLFRYNIHKEPLPPKKALIFLSVYLLIAFIIMSIFIYFLNGNVATGGGLLLWGFLGYRTLTKGYTEDKNELIDNLQEQNDNVHFNLDNVEPLNNEPTTIIFSHKCTKCGNIFRAKYTLESNRTTIPKLTVICGKCGRKEKATDDEIEASEII